MSIMCGRYHERFRSVCEAFGSIWEPLGALGHLGHLACRNIRAPLVLIEGIVCGVCRDCVGDDVRGIYVRGVKQCIGTTVILAVVRQEEALH